MKTVDQMNLYEVTKEEDSSCVEKILRSYLLG